MSNYELWCEKNNLNQTTKILFEEWMSRCVGELHSDITGMSEHIYDNLYRVYLDTFKRDLVLA